jgi:hypothetical protein
VSFAAITLCVASQRVFIVVVVVVVVIVVVLYFIIDSVRKLLDKPSYLNICLEKREKVTQSLVQVRLPSGENQSQDIPNTEPECTKLNSGMLRSR